MADLRDFLTPIDSGTKPIARGGLSAERLAALCGRLDELARARAAAWRELRGTR